MRVLPCLVAFVLVVCAHADPGDHVLSPRQSSLLHRFQSINLGLGAHAPPPTYDISAPAGKLGASAKAAADVSVVAEEVQLFTDALTDIDAGTKTRLEAVDPQGKTLIWRIKHFIVGASDTTYTKKQGRIFNQFLKRDAKSMMNLVNSIKLGNGHKALLIGGDRGGSMLVRKLVAVGRKQSLELDGLGVEKGSEQHGEQEKQFLAAVVKKLQDLKKAGKKYQVVALCETFVGGGSLNKLMSTLEEKFDAIKAELNGAQLQLLVHHQILSGNLLQAPVQAFYTQAGAARKFYKSEAALSFVVGGSAKLIHPSVKNGFSNKPKLKDTPVRMVASPFIIGEDVNFQCTKDHAKPVLVFQTGPQTLSYAAAPDAMTTILHLEVLNRMG